MLSDEQSCCALRIDSGALSRTLIRCVNLMKIRPYIAPFKFLLVALALLSAACGPRLYERPGSDEGRTVVVWISIDGIRPDYIARGNTPFFDRMMSEGAYSLAHVPIFPSLTFPSHVSQATGTTVDRHGVPLNSFHDMEAERSFFYPGSPRLLGAEPIWNTAQRQGRRTAVFDWVMSYKQDGDAAASYFNESFDGSLRDRDRIRPILNAWRNDRDRRPLQLLMGYMILPDQVGHEFGPESPEVVYATEQSDADMDWLLDQAIRIFERRMSPEDELIIMVTSDHGMSEVHTMVNPRVLTGISTDEDRNGDIVLMTSGNIGHIFLYGITDEMERAARKAAILETTRQHSFAQVYTRDELPTQWGYAHPTRVGDVVIVMETGYTFGRRARGISDTPKEAEGPLGMHGYDPATNPEMNGIFLVWRYRNPIGGIDLGPVHGLQLHATVARLLDIAPSPAALPDPVRGF